jgi:hypothetical protein
MVTDQRTDTASVRWRTQAPIGGRNVHAGQARV